MTGATGKKFVDLLNHNRIICPLKAESKTVVLKRLASLLSDASCVQETEDDIISQFVSRERLGSTVVNIENQVALPHVRLAGISAPSAALIVLSKGLVFDQDNHRARIVLGLALPQSITGSRLPLLEDILFFFSNAKNCKAIKSARTQQDAMHLIRDFSNNGSSMMQMI